MRRIRSHANYQREAQARSRAWTTGLIAVAAAVFVACCGACALWNSIGGAS